MYIPNDKSYLLSDESYCDTSNIQFSE